MSAIVRRSEWGRSIVGIAGVSGRPIKRGCQTGCHKPSSGQLDPPEAERYPELRSVFGIAYTSFIMTNASDQHSLYLLDTYCSEAESEVAAFGRNTEGSWLVLTNNIFHPQGG